MSEIRCPLNTSAEYFPDSPAIITANKTLTFSELEDEVYFTAINLKRRGLQRHSHIAILGNNSIEYCVLMLAALRIGAIICPVNNRWPQKTIERALKKLGCNVVINIPETSDFDSKYAESINAAEILPSDNDNRAAYRQPVISLDNPAVIIFTSGSTDIPKAALLTYGNLYHNAISANERIPFESGHRWLLSLPLYHVGGLGILFRSIAGGGAVVIPEKKETIADSVSHYDISHLSLVPAQLYRLIHDNNLGALKNHPIALIGGGPVSKSLIDRARQAGLRIYTTYGLTEMASQVTTAECTNCIHSGKLLNQRELTISEDNEVLVRGSTLFMGYVENDQAVLHLDDNGWFHTGDIGAIDSKGFLRILGRNDNMLISGGENIYPEEIESQLMQIDGIAQALVVSVSDEEFGQRPVAFIQKNSETKLSNNEIIEQLRKSLPKYKIPKTYLDWPGNLLTDTLKPNRQKFTELAEKS